MSLMRLWGVRSAAASFAEMVLFFCVVTPLYVFGVSYLLGGLTEGFGKVSAALQGNPFNLIALLPIWASLVVAVGYLAIVVVYWTPGDAGQNTAELRGFALFVVVSLVVAAIFLQTKYDTLGQIRELLKQVYWPRTGPPPSVG